MTPARCPTCNNRHGTTPELQWVCEACGERWCPPHDVARRALKIADDCMRSEIECHGVGHGTVHDHRYGWTDPNAREVRAQADADPYLVEAFEYLRDRGLASLIPDDGHGEQIRLHVDRSTRT